VTRLAAGFLSGKVPWSRPGNPKPVNLRRAVLRIGVLADAHPVEGSQLEAVDFDQRDTVTGMVTIQARVQRTTTVDTATRPIRDGRVSNWVLIPAKKRADANRTTART
jgi:hypothetical protein